MKIAVIGSGGWGIALRFFYSPKDLMDILGR